MGFIFAFSILPNHENVYNPSDLFDDIYNTMTEHNQKQVHYFLSILNYLDIYFLVNQKVLL